MNVAVIVNPTAGRGRALRIWKSLQPLAEASGHTVQAYLTRGTGDATRLAADAAAGGAQRVISLGGDGTSYETMNGLVGTSASFAVIPGGTGNDICRPLGIPKDPAGALAVALGEKTMAVDVGKAWDRYFLNSAGIGLDAAVCQETNAVPKYFGGTLPYLIGLTKVLFKFRPVPVTIDVDGRQTTLPLTLVAIANGPYYGGGMHIAPNAKMDDGLFDIVAAGDLSLPELIGAVPKIYSGTHLSLQKITLTRGQKVTVTSEHPLAVHLDGEVVGTLPATFEILPGALRVAVPG